MPEPQAVSLDVATAADAALVSNLLELYSYDLSDAFTNIELGPDGRFGYSRLPLYWSAPERRFAFLIRCGGRVAGLALATRGSPAAEDTDVLDVAEFFVLRRYRRAGVGRRAALLLWDRLPGKWTVRVAERNPGGRAFWRAIVAEAAGATMMETTRPGPAQTWHVYSFECGGRSSGRG
jgi:predicted acetyltransferase